MKIEIEENGISGSMVLITIFLSGLALLLTIPNIYLDNNIYYQSRKLSKLERIKITLEEEQAIIKIKLDSINGRENLLNKSRN